MQENSLSIPLLYSLDEKVTRKQLQSSEYVTPTIDPLKTKSLQEFICKHNIKYCIYWDTHYHYKFLWVPSKPHIIYYMGDINLLNKDILGIVGPRLITSYGKQIVSDLLFHAKEYNLVTISGLADGVDSICHLQSIEYNIPTIAILGGGISYYLYNHKNIIEKIIWNGGLVISEFKIGFRPTNYSFPQRNRIIAGLCDCLFLPEASEKSGSLITVDFALQINKSVYSSPNDIYSKNSKWVNKYISERKINAIYDFDIFLSSHFSHKKSQVKKKKSQIKNLTWKEKIIIDILVWNDFSFDEILYLSGLSSIELSISLSLLEIMGIISQKNIWIYSLKDNNILN